ncbi:RraA family protein [Streptomyces gobiensis]|uniref:RraA family protein n=1 Tax=Streptomyces gobiensis TaxID=2875706 RepID=UPI001E356565|nr:RraA family protein [Streptomyces gobiensis]UGY94320.1 RraA family protein [Streptomyces gobiensis]
MQTTYNELVRPPQEVVDALCGMLLPEYSPSCLVADAHPRVGAIGGLLPVKREHRVIGPALTVDLPEDGLVDILPVLPTAQPGDVIVLACHSNTRMAMWGGLMATLSQMAGIAGAVVDGAIRDVDELRDLDFPVWYRATMPRRCPPAAPPDTDTPVQVNVPVLIDGELVQPGDIVVAEENGVGVVPPALADEVLAATRQLLAKESVIRDKINNNATLAELLAEFGHL